MRDNDLYQEVILDHYKNPRNCCTLSDCTHCAEGDNPLCGDNLEIFVDVQEGRIENISFQGSGCAVSQASASLMTEHLKGHTVEEAMDAFDKVHLMLTGKHPGESSLGKLQVLSGVSEFPMRIKCASLAWHTLKSALNKKGETVSTEQ